jgi:hypothetical protein
MATAPTASLMQMSTSLGSGFGSAVMGPTGIIAQAPFIPIASSLPVVAPILAIQAMSTVTMLQQFEALDKKLDAIKNSIDIAIERNEATHIGELINAVDVIDDICLLAGRRW